MPLSEAAAVTVTRSYQTALAGISEAAGTQLQRTFLAFVQSGLTDRKDLLAWYESINPGLLSVGQQVSALTDAYASLLTDAAVTGFDGSIYAELVPTEDPFLRMWRDLGRGTGMPLAAEAGGNVALQLGTEAVQSVARNTFGKQFKGEQRWRRVLVGKSCNWCAVVATQTYRTQATATFGHTSCDCTVVPITESDPGRYINRKLYDNLDQAGVIDRASAARSATRTERAIGTNAARRDAVLEELRGETDPLRRMRLAERARSWDRRATEAAAKAAKARLGRIPTVGTGYVDAVGLAVARPT